MTDKLMRWVDSIVAAKPRFDRGEQVLRGDHADWLRTAELNRPYYGEDAYFIWVGPEWGPLELVCYDRFVFTERDHHALYTADGISSMRAWASVGARGLLTAEPPRPPKPTTRLQVTGDLRDGAHAERWRFSMVAR